jgi:putative endonuclease
MRWIRNLLARGEESVGRRGERAAAKFLQQRGFQILERNLKFIDDEADLIALDPDGATIVIVEVKTRADAQATPEIAMTQTKQFRLSRLASRLQRWPQYRDRPLRFDVIAVVLLRGRDPVIRHHVGAFESRV